MLASKRCLVGAALFAFALSGCVAETGTGGVQTGVLPSKSPPFRGSLDGAMLDASGPEAGPLGADSDGDGVVDSDDPAPTDPNGCGDSDSDTCDDCVGGSFDPESDGADADEDGICDACDAAVCGGQGTCTVVDGKAACDCDDGWEGDGCGIDIDECSLEGDPCKKGGDPEATCKNTQGGYMCTCKAKDFEFRGGTCTKDDSCAQRDNPCDDDGDADASCTVVKDKDEYTCSCSGKGFDGSSGKCLNIDECDKRDNPCDDGDDPDAKCTDNDGGYACECSGSAFDGASGVCKRSERCTDGEVSCDLVGEGNSDDPLRWSDGTASTSCASYKTRIADAGGDTPDSGVYRLDSDGEGSDSAFEAYCEMDLKGGGWRRLFEWNREADPETHTLATLQEATVDEGAALAADGKNVSPMGKLEDRSDRIQWSDDDQTYDVLAIRLDLEGAGHEVMLDLHYAGESMDTSATWFYAVGDNESQDLACFDDSSDDGFRSDERALKPYECELDDPTTFEWDEPFVVDLGETARAVHMRSFHDDGDGDRSKLYRFDVYTR